MSDLKLIDELLVHLMQAKGYKTWQELHDSSNLTRKAFQRLGETLGRTALTAGMQEFLATSLLSPSRPKWTSELQGILDQLHTEKRGGTVQEAAEYGVYFIDNVRKTLFAAIAAADKAERAVKKLFESKRIGQDAAGYGGTLCVPSELATYLGSCLRPHQSGFQETMDWLYQVLAQIPRHSGDTYGTQDFPQNVAGSVDPCPGLDGSHC